MGIKHRRVLKASRNEGAVATVSARALLCAGRADELLEDGDIDGAAVWRRILAD